MTRLRWPTVLMLMLLLAAACGDSADQSSDSTSPAEGLPAEAPAATVVADLDEAAGGEERALFESVDAAPASFQPADLGRDIIFTADLTVAVSDVTAANAEAIRVVESLGGILFAEQSRGAPQPESVLTFKVQPTDFQEALRRLGEIGEVRTQNVSAEDVTERVVDLESRIETAEASVERLKGFLAEATDIKAIAELEAQLLDRETQLETLRGQLRTIRDRVDLATIVVTFTEALAAPDLSLSVTAYRGHDGGGAACPGDSALVVEKGDDATICFEIRNVGDTPLTGFTLEDTVLELSLDDLLVVFGDPAGTLQPGQELVLAAEETADRNTRTQTRVTAVPVDQEGREIEAREVAATQSASVRIEDPGGVPGFTDGLSGAWDVLTTLGKVAVLVAGAVIPFLWVPLLVWLAVWWWRRRRARRPQPAPAPTTDPDAEAPAAETAAEAEPDAEASAAE